MIASTVESIRRSRNSFVERSSCSSARSAVTSRNARITAPVPASTVEVDTETQTGAPEVVDSWRSNASTLTPASTRDDRVARSASAGRGGDEIDELAAEQAVAREAGDPLGGAVDEQDAARVVEDDHAVGAGLEVLLERVDAAQPALGLVARARDAVRLIAQALEHRAVAQVRGGDARDQLAELEAARPDVVRRPGAACAAGSRRAARPRHCTGNTAMPRTLRDDSISAIARGQRVEQHVVDQHRRAACGSPRRPRGTRRSRA